MRVLAAGRGCRVCVRLAQVWEAVVTLPAVRPGPSGNPQYRFVWAMTCPVAAPRRARGPRGVGVGD